jgi:hypothetical protein
LAHQTVFMNMCFAPSKRTAVRSTAIEAATQ